MDNSTIDVINYIIYFFLLSAIIAKTYLYIKKEGYDMGLKHGQKLGMKEAKRKLVTQTNLNSKKVLRHIEGFETYYVVCSRIDAEDVSIEKKSGPCGGYTTIKVKDNQ